MFQVMSSGHLHSFLNKYNKNSVAVFIEYTMYKNLISINVMPYSIPEPKWNCHAA